MRRIACLIVTLALATLHTVPVRAQSNLPPHSWLFGAWTGGLFPPPSTLSAQECLALPVVIFTRDIVMRAVITDQLYAQRLVETARVTADGVEFRFAQPVAAAPAGPFSLGAQWRHQRCGLRLHQPGCAARAAPRRERDQLPRLQRFPLPARALLRHADHHQETSPT